MIRWPDPVLTLVFGGGYLALMTLVWGGLIAGVSRWGRRFPLPRAPGEAALPPVSVCVPARNEAANIAGCVEAILGSHHRDLELVVVDDHSTDGTAAAAREAAGPDPRFHLLAGAPLPPGWAGKSWALSQAAAYARHDLILFLDADVVLHPDALGAATWRVEAQHLDLLSVFGSWRLESFWERVAIPPVGWLIRGAVPLDAVNDPSRPEAFANGQFIMVRRAAYEQVGGHGVVRAEVLEDVKLARAMKRNACRLGLFHAPWAYRVRLYRDLGEIVRGYTKNFYEGMDRRPLVALGLVLFILVGTLLPFAILVGAPLVKVLLGWHLVGGLPLAWVGGLCALILLFRWRQERLDGRSGWFALTHPLGNLVLVWIALRSMFAVEVAWKGRTFQDGKAGAARPPAA